LGSDSTELDSIEPIAYDLEASEPETRETIDDVDRDSKIRRRPTRPIAKAAHMARTIPAVAPGDTSDELEVLLF
jgi:hypothetical protein